ncbi:MAG: hypothetical protein KDC98_07290 [Planctomycetes bacterium]|nr:hypothetical protein [Planctomycetota bacterium]
MSETAGAQVARCEAPPQPVALDRVMLAMDVVDTLRHRQLLVERELDDDRRQQELIERVQAIYESQGIEVAGDIVAEGVRALREDRFKYVPPMRSFEVMIAEIYVERGRWAKITAAVLFVGVLIWAPFAIGTHYRQRGLVDAFHQQVVRIEVDHRDLDALVKQVHDLVTEVTAQNPSPAARRLLADAEAELQTATTLAAAITSELAALPVPESYLLDVVSADGAVTTLDRKLAMGRRAIGAAEGLIAAARQLGTLRVGLLTAMARLEGVEKTAAEQAAIDELESRVTAAIDTGAATEGKAAMAQLEARIDGILVGRRERAELRARFEASPSALAGVDVEVTALAELERRRAAVEQAMAASDWGSARQRMAALDDLVGELNQSYELRIVSRPSDKSGVWRYRDGNRRIRNFYIIVEAVDGDGRVLTLPVLNEEDQQTSRVRSFGIRVAESVYEKVKADKLDNGLIDEVLFGRKRRGAREPEYIFPVAGGRITRW